MTGSSLRRWLERPIGERARQRAFALAATVLVLAAVVLTLTARDTNQSPAPPAPTTPAVAPVAPAETAPATTGRQRPAQEPQRPAHERQPRPVMHVARRFLTGYLPYLYGRHSAHRIVGARRSLRRRLLTNRPRVSPATRRRRARVVALGGTRVPERRRAWLVRARIADGGIAAYAIELLIERRPGGPVVVAIGGE